MTIPVVYKLTSYCSMHLMFGIGKIMDRHAWTIFTPAIGENSIFCCRASEVEDISIRRLQRTNTCNLDGLSRGISYRHLKIAEGRMAICAQVINQIWRSIVS